MFDQEPTDTRVKESERERKRVENAKEEARRRKEQQDKQSEEGEKSTGQKILESGKARGKPGEKQPSHTDTRVSAQETLDAINERTQAAASEFKKSSAEKTKESGNPYPIPPHERVPGPGPAAEAALNTAIGAVAAARDNITAQEVADARIKSDPRWERDQKILELGNKGRLGLVQPSEYELYLHGVSPEAAELMPKSAEEQAADDMERLGAAEDQAEEQAEALVRPGEQEDGTQPNNGEEADRQRERQKRNEKLEKGDEPEPPKNVIR